MRALVGHTGFVGTNLKRFVEFDDLYNSTNIQSIQGKEYDLLICAAAPASMWAANKNPEADKENIAGILSHLERVQMKRCVLISTIAVLDDYDGGYSESTAKYESSKGYGTNRRMLEVELSKIAQSCTTLRLPALFGEGLKKNFIYDILNPVPSFFDSTTFQNILASLDSEDQHYVQAYFGHNSELDVFRYDRRKAIANGMEAQIADIVERLNVQSTRFTNSDSKFQYYNLENLWSDIERCIEYDLTTLHVATTPMRAADVHLRLTGRPFVNDTPPIHREEMRSDHSRLWGDDPKFLYSADETLDALSQFYHKSRTT